MNAAVIMTPVDVVKTRLMTGGATGGIAGTFNAILKDEGAAVLMKGVVPRVCFLAPLAAMTLSLYERFGKEIVSRKTGVQRLTECQRCSERRARGVSHRRPRDD